METVGVTAVVGERGWSHTLRAGLIGTADLSLSTVSWFFSQPGHAAATAVAYQLITHNSIIIRGAAAAVVVAAAASASWNQEQRQILEFGSVGVFCKGRTRLDGNESLRRLAGQRQFAIVTIPVQKKKKKTQTKR